jgi:hypothetical protein
MTQFSIGFFDGIHPDVWEIILRSLGVYEVKNKFKDMVIPSLHKVHLLQVEDILVTPFGGGFSMAGWIESSKLGFSWIIPYYISHLLPLLHSILYNLNGIIMLTINTSICRALKVWLHYFMVTSMESLS